jgi:LysR family transcriptional regulator, transcriptional activator of nhaA
MADLLADLAMHRLDVVLSDHPAPFNPHLKVHNHSLGVSGMGWYASQHWWKLARKDFPASLDKVPVLLPTSHSTVRGPLDQWLTQHGLRPRVVGEFEDSALLETFGGSGLGVFPAALSVQDDLMKRHQVRLLGPCEGVDENYYAISTERKVKHIAVQQLLARH